MDTSSPLKTTDCGNFSLPTGAECLLQGFMKCPAEAFSPVGLWPWGLLPYQTRPWCSAFTLCRFGSSESSCNLSSLMGQLFDESSWSSACLAFVVWKEGMTSKLVTWQNWGQETLWDWGKQAHHRRGMEAEFWFVVWKRILRLCPTLVEWEKLWTNELKMLLFSHGTVKHLLPQLELTKGKAAVVGIIQIGQRGGEGVPCDMLHHILWVL